MAWLRALIRAGFCECEPETGCGLCSEERRDLS